MREIDTAVWKEMCVECSKTLSVVGSETRMARSWFGSVITRYKRSSVALMIGVIDCMLVKRVATKQTAVRFIHRQKSSKIGKFTDDF